MPHCENSKTAVEIATFDQHPHNRSHLKHHFPLFLFFKSTGLVVHIGFLQLCLITCPKSQHKQAERIPAKLHEADWHNMHFYKFLPLIMSRARFPESHKNQKWNWQHMTIIFYHLFTPYRMRQVYLYEIQFKFLEAHRWMLKKLSV